MNKEKVFEILKGYKEEVTKEEVNRVIKAYNNLFDILYEVKLCDNKFNETRWEHLDLFDFKCILYDLLDLDEFNALNTIDASTLIVRCGDNLSCIDAYLIDLVKVASEKEEKEKELYYIKLFDNTFYIIYNKDRYKQIYKSTYVSADEKILIYDMVGLYSEYLKNDYAAIYETRYIIPVAYNFFKYHHMFENNGYDIRSFIEKMKNDKDYLLNKFELNQINQVEDIFKFFISYYMESKDKRILI